MDFTGCNLTVVYQKRFGVIDNTFELLEIWITCYVTDDLAGSWKWILSSNAESNILRISEATE